MKLNRLIVLFVLFFFLCLGRGYCKNKKPALLVYGNEVEAFASALQSARSGVETYWVIPTTISYDDWSQMIDTSEIEMNLIGGIWMNVLQEVSLKNEMKDSVFKLVAKSVNGPVLQNAVEKMMNNQSRLTVLKNVDVVKILESKKNINVQLSNKIKISVRTVIDASKDRSLVKGLYERAGGSVFAGDVQNPYQLSQLDVNLVRTILAIGNNEKGNFGLTMDDVLNMRNGNLFFTYNLGTRKSNNNISLAGRLNVGQAFGACASYCAFYKVNADKLDVRKVQTELLTFKSRILPFIDVSVEDPNFAAIQRLFLVSLLPWNQDIMPFLFHSDGKVELASVQPALLKMYTRSQLWFAENDHDNFSVKDVIELLKVIAFRGNELDEEVEKNWVKRFKFKTPFDLNRIINRYEFAVLVDAYAQPFNIKVNNKGAIVR